MALQSQKRPRRPAVSSRQARNAPLNAPNVNRRRAPAGRFFSFFGALRARVGPPRRAVDSRAVARASKLTTAVAEQIALAVKGGASFKAAAELAGVTEPRCTPGELAVEPRTN